GLAFSAGKRVFFFGARVQKDRKVAAHGAETPLGHGVRVGAHYDPVAIAGLHAQQLVAYGATDDVGIQAMHGWVNSRIAWLVRHGSATLRLADGATTPKRSFSDCGWPVNSIE